MDAPTLDPGLIDLGDDYVGRVLGVEAGHEPSPQIPLGVQIIIEQPNPSADQTLRVSAARVLGLVQIGDMRSSAHAVLRASAGTSKGPRISK